MATLKIVFRLINSQMDEIQKRGDGYHSEDWAFTFSVASPSCKPHSSACANEPFAASRVAATDRIDRSEER